MKMGSSKRKSSFRIDDILHQQRAEANLQATHQASRSGDVGTPVSAGGYSTALHAGHTLPTDCSSPPGSPGALGHGPVPVRSESPKKPTALYPGLLDFSKNVLPIPLQFGVPTFNPLNAAYLEHYASVLHKASPRVWPFYPHPYSYLLPACGSKRKGGQVRFTPQQTQSLEKRFSNHKYLSPEDRRNLAIQLKLSDRQVKTWFQNRRAKWRRANGGCQSADGHGSPVEGPGDPSKNPATGGSSSGKSYTTQASGPHVRPHVRNVSDNEDDNGEEDGELPRYNRRTVTSPMDDDGHRSDSCSERGSSEERDEDDENPASPIDVV